MAIFLMAGYGDTRPATWKYTSKTTVKLRVVLDYAYILHIVCSQGSKHMTLILRGSTYHSRIMHGGRFHWKSLKTGNRNNAVKRESIIRSQLLRGEFGILDTKGTPTLAEFTPRLEVYWQTSVGSPRTATFYHDCML